MKIEDKRVLKITLTETEAEAMVRDFLIRAGVLSHGHGGDVTWCQSLAFPSMPAEERAAMFITVSEPNASRQEETEHVQAG